ncbi:MAG: hypothetical protein AB7S26_29325 [Sandaracinaceae bacterium]
MRPPTSSRLALSLALLFVGGCDCSASPGHPCDNDGDCPTNQTCIDGMCESRDASGRDAGGGGGFDAGTARTIASVRIEPAVADLIATDGAMPTQQFMAVVTYSDGVEGSASGPSWAIDDVGIGLIDLASGLFTANGAIGGTRTVTVTVPNGGSPLSATATVNVLLDLTDVPATIMDAPTRFGAVTPVDDAARAIDPVYPLDQVVMPQNVYPADVQWNVGEAGDLFRVTLTKPHATFTGYVEFDGNNHYLVAAAGWRGIAQTDPDSPATLVVDRLHAASGEVVRGVQKTLTFARAALTGSVYYWDIERGRIVRIDDGTATRVEFLPNPEQGCVGCHSVSPSGRYMAGRFGGGNNTGSVMDLTTDLTPNPVPTIFPANFSRWWFSSWNPAEDRLVIARDAPTLAFIDPMNGNDVPVTGALPSGTYPSWSPDGNTIAFVSEQNGWGDNPSQGNVWVLPVTGRDAVGTAARIHDGTTLPGGACDSYPTWTPDSGRIAFAHGTGARSESTNASLYWMAADGSDVVALANGGGTNLDFQPRFSPFHQGGYYWLSFLSRRTYGNAQVGNAARPTNRNQQIWVTAIRDDAAPGADASSVPYWLPGQNAQSANISAYWAPRPCRPEGVGCSVGTECCSGDCRPPAGGGEPVCSPPPPERCRVEGETCDTDGDCCPDMGLSCIGNVCVAGPG